MGREILVCISKLQWSYPHYVGGETCYYIEDEKKGVHSNIEEITIEEIAEDVYKGAGLSKPLQPEDEIIFEPFVDARTRYANGYFGRRPVPANVHSFEPLEIEDRKKFESHLEMLRNKAD